MNLLRTPGAIPTVPGIVYRLIQAFLIQGAANISLSRFGNRVSIWTHWFLVAWLLLNALHRKTYLIITVLANQDLDLTTA
jgi:hypothetical protein